MTRLATTRLNENGRVVIPAEFRAALDLHPGDELIVSVDGGELRMWTRREALRRAQAIAARYAREGVSVTDEFIAERRAEAQRE